MAPVSFGSIHVFTINDGKPKAGIPSLMNMSFNNNSNLKRYNLTDMRKYDEKIDGTVHNAAKNFAEKLDKEYLNELPKGSRKVILTEADFYVNPRETQKRYFLTAATDADEERIHKILSKSSIFYAARYGYKK
ncbi:MAG: hypothetical protein LUH05_00755 [Candidatus Gastranaerophilales bacterium]|nr:hypothetical protein [Candidatus Gastranaerophilales bacterium]